VQVIDQAAFFSARGANQGTQFGLQNHFLAFTGTKLHDERHGIFRELGAGGRPGFARTSACPA
jgi:hypothetical protein